MILSGVILGAVLGGLTARGRGGSAWDVAHYAGVGALMLGVVAVAVQIVIGRVA